MPPTPEGCGDIPVPRADTDPTAVTVTSRIVAVVSDGSALRVGGRDSTRDSLVSLLADDAAESAP